MFERTTKREKEREREREHAALLLLGERDDESVRYE